MGETIRRESGLPVAKRSVPVGRQIDAGPGRGRRVPGRRLRREEAYSEVHFDVTEPEGHVGGLQGEAVRWPRRGDDERLECLLIDRFGGEWEGARTRHTPGAEGGAQVIPPSRDPACDLRFRQGKDRSGCVGVVELRQERLGLPEEHQPREAGGVLPAFGEAVIL